MTKQAREDVEKLLEELRPLLKAAKIPEHQINVAKGRNYKVHHFAAAYDWLHQLSLCPQLAEVRKAYALREPEVWAMYDAMGTEGLREQEILQEAGIKLQKRWRVKRPRIFGKDKNEDDGSKQEETQENSE